MNIWEKSILTVLAAATIASAFTVSDAEARILVSPAEEQQAGFGEISRSGVVYQETNPALQLVQDTIIRWNKDRLQKYTANSRRGLRPVHLLITNGKINAYSIPGGHIFVSDGLITAFMAREFDPYTGIFSEGKQFGNGYEIYGHSAIAATIAHEDSHWERNFLQNETDVVTGHISKQKEDTLKMKLRTGDGAGYMHALNAHGYSANVFPAMKEFIYQEELRADLGAMELLDNTDAYSPGSLITVVRRMKDSTMQQNAAEISHPTASVRTEQVIGHIRRLSGGRVVLDKEGRMSLDGKLFLGSGYLPARKDVTAFDRTVYVAGQLAKCVHYKSSHIVPLDDDTSIRKSQGMIPFVAICDADTNRRFVIDKFDVSPYDAVALASIKRLGRTKEQETASEIIKFLTKVK